MKSTTEMREEMQAVFLRVTRTGQQGPYQEEERKGRQCGPEFVPSSNDFLAYSHSTPAHLEEAYSLALQFLCLAHVWFHRLLGTRHLLVLNNKFRLSSAGGGVQVSVFK